MPVTPVFSGLQLGRGCDHAISKTFGWAVAFEPGQPLIPSAGQTTEFTFHVITSSSDLADSLNVAASAAFPIKGVIVAPEAKYVASSSIQRFATYILVKVVVKNAEIVIKHPRLTDHAKGLLGTGDWELFAKSYGLEYMSGVTAGGSYIGLIEVATRTEQEQIEIKSKVGGVTVGVKAEAEFGLVLKEITNNKAHRVTIFQSGGSGDPLEVELQEMIDQAKTFPALVQANPVPLQALVERYEDTVPLPAIPPPDSLTRIKRRDVLEELGRKYLEYKDTRSTIDYVLRHMLDFEMYKDLDEDDLARRRTELQQDFQGVSRQMNDIAESARRCYESFDACDLPTAYYQPTAPLPQLGGQDMTIRQLEDKVAQLQMRLEAMQAGIENGSVIAQKARMLLARDDNFHFLRWRYTDETNRDNFELWRADNTWYPLITVNSAKTIACSQDFNWNYPGPPVRMWHSSRSAAFLTRVTGKFEGGGEWINIFVGDGGFWYLGGDTMQGFMSATARCIGTP